MSSLLALATYKKIPGPSHLVFGEGKGNSEDRLLIKIILTRRRELLIKRLMIG